MEGIDSYLPNRQLRKLSQSNVVFGICYLPNRQLRNKPEDMGLRD